MDFCIILLFDVTHVTHSIQTMKQTSGVCPPAACIQLLQFTSYNYDGRASHSLTRRRHSPSAGRNSKRKGEKILKKSLKRRQCVELVL